MPASETKTGGQVLVEGLDAWGVETVFGMPGIHTLAVYDALYQHPRIRHVTVRHEQGAGFMADGYARAAGRVGVVLTTTGPAAMNALTPLGEAYAESSPVLLIASGLPEGEAGRELGTLHEMRDQFGTLTSVTGQGQRVLAVEEIPLALATAFAALQRHRPRPYILEIPFDVLDAETAIEAGGPTCLPPPTLPEQGALEAVAGLLDEAARPLLLAGGGAQGAADQVRQLAECLQAPVGMTVNGLGVVPDDHPLCLGDADSPRLDAKMRNLGRDFGRWLGQADLVLAIGTRLGERTVRAWDAALGRLVHLDIDPAVSGRRSPVEVALVGDAGASLQVLLDLLGPQSRTSAWDMAALAPPLSGREEGVFAAVLEAMRRVLARDSVTTHDMTGISYRARRLFPVYSPRAFLAPHYYGTLGFSLPAAIGAKIACPQRQVVACCGDGGFLFTAQELSTAVQQELALPVILCNDEGYTAIQQAQERRFGDRYIGVELANPDFVQFARSFGAEGVRVHGSAALEAALQRALRAKGPTLIEVYVPGFRA